MESLDLSEDGPSNFSKIFSLKTTYEPKKFSIFKILEKFKNESLITKDEYVMINKILNLKDISIYNVMTHRINIKAVEKIAKIEDVVEIFVSRGFSKIPVYEEDIDKIIGFVNARELFNLKKQNKLKAKDIVKHVKKTLYMPESVKCEAALVQLKREKQELAVVVDEYGGTSGIITLADIKNFVFNEIGREFKESELKTNDENSLVLEGKTSLKDVGCALNIKIGEENNTETLGGFLVGVLGRIPEKNETPVVSYGGFKFKILSMERQQVKQVEAVKLNSKV